MKDGDSRLCGRRSSVLAIHDDEAGFMNNNSTLEAMTPPPLMSQLRYATYLYLE